MLKRFQKIDEIVDLRQGCAARRVPPVAP